MFGDWLQKTKKLQADAFGVDFDEMTDEERMGYISWNTLAGIVESCEGLQELPWKPWAEGRTISEDARLKAIKEIVDELHFKANILCALRCTEEELAEHYEEKMEENRRRQAEGYHNRGVGERQL